MIKMSFFCETIRLTMEMVEIEYQKYNDNEKAKEYATADFPFLEALQSLILDKYFDTDEYIKSYIYDMGAKDVGEGQTVDSIIEKHYQDLPEPYKSEVQVLLGNGTDEGNYLIENIEPLYYCYQITHSIEVIQG